MCQLFYEIKMKIGEDLHFSSCQSPVVLAMVISNIGEMDDLNLYC